MSEVRSTRRVYSADELHGLRNACSVPRLREAIEAKDGEDAELVKEHVLRGARSFAARSFRSRPGYEGSRVPSDRTNNENLDFTTSYTSAAAQSFHGVLGEIASNNQLLRAIPSKLRPSPTPSLKRKKAEAIVRAHGSPTHVRVTAGGRIVPREQSPLCFPRFGYSAIKANGGLIKFAPNLPHGKAAQWSQTPHEGLQNGFVAQDTEGRLCQVVNGAILPLTEADGALRLYMPAPNLNITHREPLAAMPTEAARYGPEPRVQLPPVPTVPSTTSQINALELEYAKFEHELKELDKTEVIHGKTMSKAAKEALVAKRRELVINMDKIRKAIKALKEQPQPPLPSSASRTHSAHSSMSPPMILLGSQHGPIDHSKIMQEEQTYANAIIESQPVVPMASSFHMPGFAMPEHGFLPGPWMLAPGVMMHPPPFDSAPGWQMPLLSMSGISDHEQTDAKSQSQAPRESRMPQHDGTASKSDLRSPSARHSHALELKDPETKQVVNLKSLLDPKSPVYKPNHDRVSETDLKSTKDRSPTPLLFNSFAALSLDSSGHNLTGTAASSSHTSDFFIEGTGEHPLRKGDRAISGHSSDKENEPPQDCDVHNSKAADMYTFPSAPPGTPAVVGVGRLEQEQQPDAIQAVLDNHTLNMQASVQDPTVNKEVFSSYSHDGNASETGKRSSDIKIDHAAVIDFSNMSPEWLLGYQAGLQRRAVNGACGSTFLDGYCSGLLKSQPQIPSNTPTSRHMNHDEQHTCSAASFSGAPTQISQSQIHCRQNVYDNESAMPAQDLAGSLVEDMPQNLSAWQKEHQEMMSAHGQGLNGFPFPERGSSLPNTNDHRMLNSHDSYIDKDYSDESVSRLSRRGASHAHPLPHSSSEDESPLRMPTMDKQHSEFRSSSNQIVSSSHKEGLAYRPFSNTFGHRMPNPLEWRSGSSIAHVANLSTGFFANAQFDGQPSEKLTQYNDSMPLLSSAADMAASPIPAANSRFKEASLDELSPPASPRAYSASVSPKMTARHASHKLRKGKVSPAKDDGKLSSPSKGRLEHFAEKVGIRSSPDKAGSDDIGSSPSKHRWRDIWKGARRDVPDTVAP